MDRSAHSTHRTALQSVLKKSREDKKLRQIDISKALNVPQSFISKYESGERRLDLVELEQVATAIGESLETIVKRYLNATSK